LPQGERRPSSVIQNSNGQQQLTETNSTGQRKKRDLQPQKGNGGDAKKKGGGRGAVLGVLGLNRRGGCPGGELETRNSNC